MASLKATFTLDTATMAILEDAAERLAKPKSAIVRDAIHDFHERIGRLSEREKLRMLQAFDELVPKIPKRSSEEVDREIHGIRQARKKGGPRVARPS